MNSKREKIITIALQLFMKKGYENTSLEDIMLETQLSKGGLYHYFKSKEQLLDGVISYYIEKDKERYEELLSKEVVNAKEKLFNFLLIPFEIENRNAITIKIEKNSIFYYRASILSRVSTSRLVSAIIIEGIENGEFEVEYANIIGTTVYDVIMNLYDNLNNESISDVQYEVGEVCFIIQKILDIKDSEIETFKNKLTNNCEISYIG